MSVICWRRDRRTSQAHYPHEIKQTKEQEKEEVQLDQSEVSTSANCVELNMLLIPEGKNIVRTSAKEKRYLHGNENTKRDIIRHPDKTLKK